MGFVSSIKSLTGIATKSLPEAGSNAGNLSGFFIPFGAFSTLCKRSNRKTYEESAILSTVINKRAQCFGNAVVYVKDKQGNEPTTLAATRLRNLLDSPNPFMSWEQLYRITDVHRMLYGHCVWLKLRAFEGDIPTALYIVDPEQLQIDVDKNSPFIGREEVRGIRIGGLNTTLTLDDLIIFNDIKAGFTAGSVLAESRMTALSDENKLLQVISDAELSIIRNRGAIGILAKDGRDQSAAGVYDDTRDDIQRQYKRYGISSDQWSIIITSAALKWYSITQPLKDLMLTEFEEHVAKKVCGMFDVAFELYPMSGQSTYENRNEALRELYQNTVMPCSKGDARTLTRALCGGTGLTITLDYSDMYFLQADMKQKADSANVAITAFNAAQAAGNITRDEWRALAAEYINIDPSAALLEQKVMFAQQLGVGGLQSLMSLLVDVSLTPNQKRALLVSVFDRTPEEALEMIPEVETINAIGNV